MALNLLGTPGRPGALVIWPHRPACRDYRHAPTTRFGLTFLQHWGSFHCLAMPVTYPSPTEGSLAASRSLHALLWAPKFSTCLSKILRSWVKIMISCVMANWAFWWLYITPASGVPSPGLCHFHSTVGCLWKALSAWLTISPYAYLPSGDNLSCQFWSFVHLVGKRNVVRQGFSMYSQTLDGLVFSMCKGQD